MCSAAHSCTGCWRVVNPAVVWWAGVVTHYLLSTHTAPLGPRVPYWRCLLASDLGEGNTTLVTKHSMLLNYSFFHRSHASFSIAMNCWKVWDIMTISNVAGSCQKHLLAYLISGNTFTRKLVPTLYCSLTHWLPLSARPYLAAVREAVAMARTLEALLRQAVWSIPRNGQPVAWSRCSVRTGGSPAGRSVVT